MPTLDDVCRKFGEASEAAQLLETELGTLLLFFGAVGEGFISPTLEVNKHKAADLLDRINRQTLGQLIKSTKRHTDVHNQLEPLLWSALEERNRLSHHCYRQHNLRWNSDEGRAIMMKDLESIHDTLIEAYKALMLLSGIDLEALTQNVEKSQAESPAVEPAPLHHLPI